ncbi:unnamed protein product [Tenebrio molitor]|nr:unnamed protein product [Tenebrio molitor]
MFGYFPVLGVLSSSPSYLGFSWFSLRILSSTVTYTCGIVVILGHIRFLIVEGYEQIEMNGVIFYSSGTLSCMLFIKLAIEWKQIMLKWQEVDTAMVSYGWPKNLERRLKIISTIFLLLEAAEHFSIQANKLIVAVECRGSISKGFEHFSVNMSFPVIFDVIKPFYSAWLGILLQCVNTRMAFSWTFIDLFIILISCALAMRFRQLNNRVRCMKDMKILTPLNYSVIKYFLDNICFRFNRRDVGGQ